MSNRWFWFLCVTFVLSSCGRAAIEDGVGYSSKGLYSLNADSSFEIAAVNPIEGMAIEVYMPQPSRDEIDEPALQEVSRNLRLGAVSFTDGLPENLGYDSNKNILHLQLDLREDQVYDSRAGGYLLGYSDPINISHFWVSLKQLDLSYSRYVGSGASRGKSAEQYLKNGMSYTVAHEIFNHEIGIAIMGRPFQIDLYDEKGTLNSAEPSDVWENTARTLSPASAFLTWKRRKGYP